MVDTRGAGPNEELQCPFSVQRLDVRAFARRFIVHNAGDGLT